MLLIKKFKYFAYIVSYQIYYKYESYPKTVRGGYLQIDP